MRIFWKTSFAILQVLHLLHATGNPPPTSFRSETLIIHNAAKNELEKRSLSEGTKLDPATTSTEFKSKLYSKSSQSSAASSATLKRPHKNRRRGGSRHSGPSVSGAIGSVALTPLLLEGFSRLGVYMIQFGRLHYPQVPRGVIEMTIVFHGANGYDNATALLMMSLNRTVSPYNFLLNWDTYSHNTIQAPFNAERIGKEVARRLPARIRRIHVIGISVGAHAADACVRQLKRDRSHHIYIQETLLNPVCARGLLDLEYGERVFGRAADYAQHFWNRNDEDALSFTNSPCLKCAVHDVTLRRPRTFVGQEWPLHYYVKSQDHGFVDDANKHGRGVVIVHQ
jgi:hypothetical protein